MKSRMAVSAISAAVLGLAIGAFGADMSDCPMHKGGAGASHPRGVEARGDEGMGFSHEKTTHHFLLSPDGGSFVVTANAASDEGSRDSIRMHLKHIAKAFSEGDCAIPMFVHDTVPPGVSTMKRRRETIEYRFEEVPGGARVRLSTRDADALDAIHDFLRFQIADHGTGDAGRIEETR